MTKSILVAGHRGSLPRRGHATLDPHDIAATFWELAERRESTSVTFG